MPNYYFIHTKLDSLSVIDSRMQTAPSVGLQLFPQNHPESDNQLWQFVPDVAGSRFCLLKSKGGLYVIDVKGGKASERGTALQIHIPNESGFGQNQLWEFVPDPAGSGYFFIKSKLGDYVIDVKGGASSPHTHLQLFPQNRPGKTEGQLWMCRPSATNSYQPRVTVQAGEPSSIRLDSVGFVALGRISLSFTVTDPAGVVTISSGPGAISSVSNVHGAFQCTVPVPGTGLPDGSTLDTTLNDGNNQLDLRAVYDAPSKTWRIW